MADSTNSPKRKRVRTVRERSAGVVVYRRNPATGVTEYLLLDYGRHWDYPKGHLEKGESDVEAARRELREETGLTDVRLVEGFSREILYHFQSSRKGLVRKEVIFFGAELDFEASQQIQLSNEHVGYVWLGYAEALERLTFANARAVLSSLSEYLGQARGPSDRT